MEKITKKQVEEIIYSQNYECEYRMNGNTEIEKYDGCEHNLDMILNERSTRVSIADADNPDYKEGYKTIIMNAPCMNTQIFLRLKEQA